MSVSIFSLVYAQYYAASVFTVGVTNGARNNRTDSLIIVLSSPTLYHVTFSQTIHLLPEVKKFYPSTIVNYLIAMCIQPIATELAEQNLPLAGGLQYFAKN